MGFWGKLNALLPIEKLAKGKLANGLKAKGLLLSDACALSFEVAFEELVFEELGIVPWYAVSLLSAIMSPFFD